MIHTWIPPCHFPINENGLRKEETQMKETKHMLQIVKCIVINKIGGITGSASSIDRVVSQRVRWISRVAIYFLFQCETKGNTLELGARNKHLGHDGSISYRSNRKRWSMKLSGLGFVAENVYISLPLINNMHSRN